MSRGIVAEFESVSPAKDSILWYILPPAGCDELRSMRIGIVLFCLPQRAAEIRKNNLQMYLTEGHSMFPK